jgi:hypothetical protein
VFDFFRCRKTTSLPEMARAKAARIFWHSAMENSYKVESEDIMKHWKICYLTERLVSSVVENAQLTTELAQQAAEIARLNAELKRLRSCELAELI